MSRPPANPHYDEKILGKWTPTEELVAQGAPDLRALGLNVDSNATRPPPAADATPVPAKPGHPSTYEEGISFLDAAIARAGGEPVAEEHGLLPQPPPGRTPARAKFAARAAKHRSPPQPPKPPKPPRSPQDDSMEAIGLMVEQCHVAREEGDDDAVVAALLPLLNAARHQGDEVVKALADAALKGSKPRLLASLEVAATVAATSSDASSRGFEPFNAASASAFTTSSP